MRVNRISFATDANPNYALFWPVVKRHALRNFDLVPHLTYVGDRSDEIYREIVSQAGEDLIDVVPHCRCGRWQAPWAAFYGTTFMDPEDVAVTVGIDQIMVSRDIIDHPDVAASDGSDYFSMLTRNDIWRACRNRQVPPALLRSGVHPKEVNMPSGYHIGKVWLFREVYGFEDRWIDELRKVGEFPHQRAYEYKTRALGSKWGRDESHSSEMLRRWIARGGDVRTPFGADAYNCGGKWSDGNSTRYDRHYRRTNTRDIIPVLMEWVENYETVEPPDIPPPDTKKRKGKPKPIRESALRGGKISSRGERMRRRNTRRKRRV